MARYDASTATCHVFTYKEGLLSKLAHDLKIEVTSFTIDASADAIEASFDPRSLRVACCMKDGREAPGTLSDRNKRTIEDSIAKDVLNAKRHPKITFTSTRIDPRDDGGFDIQGDLALHGARRPVSLRVTREGGALQTRVRLHQPDFGIKPYQAMMGTLKIKPAVEVTLSLPEDAL